MDIESIYEISRTAVFIRSRNFSRVALQFPDELLKDSTKVVSALRDKLHCSENNESDGNVGLYVMADTAYGSCCVDEVGASHINADCVVHYGHTCLSPTSKLPAFFVFGRAPISVSNCTEKLINYASTSDKPAVLLFGLEYAHAIEEISEAWAVRSSTYCGSTTSLEPCFAKSTCSIMDPSETCKAAKGHPESDGGLDANQCTDEKIMTRTYSIGGLTWGLPEERNIEEYMLYWIGADNAAFAHLVLTFNECEIVRYDPSENYLVTDVSQQRRILKRRYYLVEKAKDANIIGILVGTLGVAGYLHMIHQMKELITRAGKKAYTLVMGRPNPAKLANFPECDVFIYVSCAQTALLDSKEFLAPVITPYEAMLAFSRVEFTLQDYEKITKSLVSFCQFKSDPVNSGKNRKKRREGSQWTGAYVMGFQNLMTPLPVVEARDDQMREGRFSFLQGGYVEDFDLEESSEEKEDESLALVKATERALQVRDSHRCIVKGTAKSGAEFLAARSYQGLENRSKSSLPEPFFVGRTGKASGYEGEEGKKNCSE